MSYEFRLIPSPTTVATQDAVFRAWLNAVARGFHMSHTSDDDARAEAELRVDEQWTLRAVHATAGIPDLGMAADEPVATFVEWRGELSLGEDRSVPAHQISDVTVRQTHRRHGLLRRMMEESLATAHADGVPVAALTATEATIYGRFGFGPATFDNHVTVDAGPGFALTHSPAGRVEYVDLANLPRISEQVFSDFHRQQAGSISRGRPRHRRLTGEVDRLTNAPSTKLRAAAHWDDTGAVDGYVTWRYTGEFGKEQLTVQDLVTTNDEAHLALWLFLGTSDLVEKVHWRQAPGDDALPWALVNRRDYAVTGTEDVLWLRVLDPVSLLTTRTYRQDGEVGLHIVDPLGFAAGAWRLTVTDGTATLTPIPAADAEVDLDVTALGSLILGGVRAATLFGAGTVRGDAAVVDILDRLLRTSRIPRCLTHF